MFLSHFGFVRTGALLLLAACTLDGPPGSGNVSSDSVAGGTVVSATQGGVVTSTDGRASLTIPAGALAEDVEILIEPVKPGDLADGDKGTGVLAGWKMTPDGVAFGIPAMAVFDIPAQDVPTDTDSAGSSVFGVLSEGEDGSITALAGGFVTTIDSTLVVGTPIARLATMLVVKLASIELETSCTLCEVGAPNRFTATVRSALGSTISLYAFFAQIAGDPPVEIGVVESPLDYRLASPETGSFLLAADVFNELPLGGIGTFFCNKAGKGSLRVAAAVEGKEGKLDGWPTGVRQEVELVFDQPTELKKGIECIDALLVCPSGTSLDNASDKCVCDAGTVDVAGSCVCDTGTVDNGTGACVAGIGDFANWHGGTLHSNALGCNIGSEVLPVPGAADPSAINLFDSVFRLKPGSKNVATATNVTRGGQTHASCTVTVSASSMDLVCKSVDCSESFNPPL